MRRTVASILLVACIDWIGIAVYYKLMPNLTWGSPGQTILIFMMIGAAFPVLIPIYIFEEKQKRTYAPPLLALLAPLVLGVLIGPFLALLTLGPALSAACAKHYFPGDKSAALALMAVGMGIMVGFVMIYGRVTSRRQRKSRDAAIAAEQIPDDPIVRPAYELLKRKLFVKPRDLAKCLTDSGAQDADCALLVCIGDCEIPEIGDSKFEPEVFPAHWRASGMFTMMVVWTTLLVGFEFLTSRSGWQPLKSLFPSSPFSWSTWIFWIVMIGPFFAGWTWSILFPVYIRLAPGVIQVIRYNWARNRPTCIRSYPLHAGTMVIVYTIGRLPASFALVRGECEDRFQPFGRRDDETGLFARTWHAIFSTSPTPPLSETQLVG